MSWLTGTTTSILACGENANKTKSELYEITLKTLGFNNTVLSFDDGPFWPRQDLAVLQVEFPDSYPPPVSLRKSEIQKSEELHLMGYPGITLRDFTKKD